MLEEEDVQLLVAWRLQRLVATLLQGHFAARSAWWRRTMSKHHVHVVHSVDACAEAAGLAHVVMIPGQRVLSRTLKTRRLSLRLESRLEDSISGRTQDSRLSLTRRQCRRRCLLGQLLGLVAPQHWRPSSPFLDVRIANLQENTFVPEGRLLWAKISWILSRGS